MPRPLFLTVSDLHLTLNAPPARAAEKDWLAAQERPIRQFAKTASELNVPILCAGDIFHKSDPPPELINWAIDVLPNMNAIPGQHDLPYHNIKQIEKSGYWTLVLEGTIHHLDEVCTLCNGVIVHPFQFGEEIKTRKKTQDFIHVCLTHKYVWKPGCSFEGAPEENRYDKLGVEGYQYAVFGDNHRSFLASSDSTQIINCGTMQRRKADEYNYIPCYYVVWDDGSIKRISFDISEDKWEYNVEEVKKQEELLDTGLLMEKLKNLSQTALDFSEAINRILETTEVDEDTKVVLLDAMKRKK